MPTLGEYRNEQLQKLQALKDLGVNPYPARSFRDTDVSAILLDKIKQGAGACVAGRLLSRREHGGVQFIDIDDGTGELQLIVHEDALNAEYPKGLLAFKDLSLLTRGDFVEAAGVVGLSQTGQTSLEVKGFRVLSKVLRPLPEKLEDTESRFRRRYQDMSINTDVRDRFYRRSQFWKAAREFLDADGFSEINIPVLEHTTGGADANPFVTHMDALGEDFYLRISHELPLKRLLGAGFNKVYDIGPRFRNEGYTDEHLPEHVAMEWYWAYANWRDGMDQLRRMFIEVAKKTWGSTCFDWNGTIVELDTEWEEWDYATVIKDRYGIDIFNCGIEDVAVALKDNGLQVDKDDSIPRGIDKLWKNIRKDVAGPIWLINTPAFISPLSKQDDQNPDITQRFQAVAFGSELSNGFSELNDPQDQLERFVQQQKMRDGGDDEAMMLDIDYVEMLEYGMPPACGFGISERVFWVLEGVTAREGVPFPQLRRDVDQTTKDIYPQIYGPDGLIANAGNKTQDFTKRIVAVVRKDLENWQVANAAAHMSAYHAHKMAKDEFDSGEFFLTKDSHELPRNSQYPILIKKAELKDLRKLQRKAKEAGVKAHVFIKEMIETTDDSEIIASLKDQAMDEVDIYGVGLYGDNDAVNALTKHYSLWN